MATKILRAVCALLAALFTLAAIASVSVNEVIYSDRFIPGIADDEYVQYIHGKIAEELKANESYYDIDIRYLTDYIDDAEIKRECDKYFAQLHSVLTGKAESIESIDFSDSRFLEGINAFAATLDKSEFEFHSDAAGEIAADAAATAAGNIAVMPAKYLTAAARITASNKLGIVKYYYIFAAAALMFALLCVVIPRSGLMPKLTLAASSIFIPSLSALVLMIMVTAYDFGSKVMLADTPLKQVVIRAVDKVCTVGVTASAVLTAVFGAVFIVFMILRVVRIRKSSSDK